MTIDVAEATELKTEDSKAVIARKLIAISNMKYPQSITAMGCLIARYCQEHKLDPTELKHELFEDHKGIEKLVAAAQNAHISAGKNVLYVDTFIMGNVIRGGFNYAERFINLPGSVITEIEDAHSRFHAIKGDIHKKEGPYQRFAGDVIDRETP